MAANLNYFQDSNRMTFSNLNGDTLTAEAMRYAQESIYRERERREWEIRNQQLYYDGPQYIVTTTDTCTINPYVRNHEQEDKSKKEKEKLDDLIAYYYHR